jgi:hypothetical protein
MLFGVGLMALVVCASAAAEPASPATIDKLIQQLGSPAFEEREKATQDLDRIGEPALEALRKAMNSNDAEVSRRARDLMAGIEKRVLHASVLKATRVHLVGKNTPLTEVAADLEKKSGCPIHLNDPLNQLKGRRITLDTGETTFWDALAQLCRSAGLVESRTTNPFNFNFQPPNGFPKGKMPEMAPMGFFVSAPGQVILTPGKGEPPPSDTSSSMRVCVREKAAQAVPPRDGEIVLELHVTPEPRWRVDRILTIRVEKAIDDRGQSLALGAPEAPPAKPGKPARPVMETRPLFGPGSDPHHPVRLLKGAQPSRSLRELKGSLTAQVLLEPLAMVAVDNFLESAGKTIKGKDGSAIKVLEVKQDANGLVTARFELTHPADMVPDDTPARAPLAGKPGAGQFMPAMPNTTGISLEDAQGNVLPATIYRNFAAREESGLFCYPFLQGQGAPSRLVFKARHGALLDIPFTLKDVSLPR